jgi:hypothetical protein
MPKTPLILNRRLIVTPDNEVEGFVTAVTTFDDVDLAVIAPSRKALRSAIKALLNTNQIQTKYSEKLVSRCALRKIK